MTRPGDRLRAMAARLFSARTMAHVIDPIIADLQAECADAVRNGQLWRSRGVRVAGYVAFLKVIVAHGCGRFVRGWPADEQGTLLRTVACSLAAVATATLLLIAPPLHATPASLHPSRMWLVVDLVPQALPIAIPLGTMVGIFCGLGRRLTSARLRVAVMLLALAWSATSLITVAWLVPAGNQAFRTSVFGPGVVRGVTELTMGELAQLLKPGTHEPMLVARPADRRSLEWQYDFRAALAAAPVALACFALSVIGRRRRRPLTLVLAAGAAVAGYYVCIWGARRLVIDDMLPVFATVWLPNVAFAVVSAALMVVNVERPRTPSY